MLLTDPTMQVSIHQKFIEIIMQLIRTQNTQLLEIIMKEEKLTRIKLQIPTYWDIKDKLFHDYSSSSSSDVSSSSSSPELVSSP